MIRLWTAPPNLERAVTVLRGMAYEHRLHILVVLTDGEQTAGALADALATDPAVLAHHLRALRAARLIRRRRRGRNVFYSLTSAATEQLITEVFRYAGGPD